MAGEDPPSELPVHEGDLGATVGVVAAAPRWGVVEASREAEASVRIVADSANHLGRFRPGGGGHPISQPQVG